MLTIVADGRPREIPHSSGALATGSRRGTRSLDATNDTRYRRAYERMADTLAKQVRLRKTARNARLFFKKVRNSEQRNSRPVVNLQVEARGNFACRLNSMTWWNGSSARGVAECLTDRDARRIMLGIADEYDKLVRQEIGRCAPVRVKVG